jgi:hypothetical protein
MSAGLVWLEGSPETTVERTPAGVIFEIDAVKPPL